MENRLRMKKSIARESASYSLLKVTPEMHDRVKDLAAELNRQPVSVASELLEWAMERVEIIESDPKEVG